MASADFLIIGGGVAGLSAAARLAAHGKVVLLEGEEGLGYHSSGRSATFSHFGIGNETVRALTRTSQSFFAAPPDDFSPVPLARMTPALFVAREEMLGELDALHDRMAPLSPGVARVSEAEMLALCPLLRVGGDGVVAAVVDRNGQRLDADALLQGYARQVRGRGGEVLTSRRVAEIGRVGADWQARTEDGDSWTAPVLINAAGAWADRVAELADVRPIGLSPKRRTIIVFDPPTGTDVRDWPFVKSVVDEFYMLPEAGRLMASPVDEVDDEPCDAQPEDYDVALAAYRVEQYTVMRVARIAHRWAGLRSFTRDRVPAAGFAPDAPGFFWLAGQGGFGLQTAPAMAAAVEALIADTPWPAQLSEGGVEAGDLAPERLLQPR